MATQRQTVRGIKPRAHIPDGLELAQVSDAGVNGQSSQAVHVVLHRLDGHPPVHPADRIELAAQILGILARR